MEITKENLEYLRSTRPHICVPCYGGQLTESFFISVLKLINFCNGFGIHYSVETIVNESLVTRARNSLTAKMMYPTPKSTHLIFIDADIEFEVTDFIKLLLADKDVIGGIYPKKSLPIDYVINTMPDAKKDGTLLEVKRLGTGFMCIKRHVIEKMFEEYKHLKYTDSIGLDPKFDEYKYALFDTAIDESGTYLSEDYVFCDRWKKMGGEIWTDLSIILGHVGYYKFKPNTSDVQKQEEPKETNNTILGTFSKK
jgi:hypothetical protein